MPALATDRIWTTRPGVSPTVAGEPCDFLLLADIAGGFAAGSIASSAISGTVAPSAHTHVVADITDFATGVAASETTTSLSYNAGTTTLTYTDEDGAATNISLAALTTDIYITGASFAGSILTLTDNDGGTANVTVDLASFSTSSADNGNGTHTLTFGNGTSQVVPTSAVGMPIADAGNLITATDVEAALQELATSIGAIHADDDVETVTGTLVDVTDPRNPIINFQTAAQTTIADAGNLITATTVEGALQELAAGGGATIVSAAAGNLITDSTGAFLNQAVIQANETTTSLAQATATGIITYTDEDAGTQTAVVRSTDADQILTNGSDGGVFLKAPTTQLP